MQDIYTIDEASDFFHVDINAILLIELRELGEEFPSPCPVTKVL